MTWDPKNYYLRWLAHAFRGPWGVASLVGSILALVVPAFVRYVPDVQARAAAANDLLWQIPLAMLILLVGVRLVTAPKFLHDTERQRVTATEAQLHEMRNDRRASIVVSRVTQWIEDDPQSPEPYTNEYLRFTNVGPETALTVRIEPMAVGDREVKLWEPIDLIRSGEHQDRMTHGGLSAAFQQWRKARGFDFRQEVRIPLVVRYTDRNGGDWRTPHVVVFQGFDVRVEPIRSASDVAWTDVAAL